MNPRPDSLDPVPGAKWLRLSSQGRELHILLDEDVYQQAVQYSWTRKFKATEPSWTWRVIRRVGKPGSVVIVDLALVALGLQDIHTGERSTQRTTLAHNRRQVWWDLRKDQLEVISGSFLRFSKPNSRYMEKQKSDLPYRYVYLNNGKYSAFATIPSFLKSNRTKYNVFLGRFDTAEEAARQVDRGLILVYGTRALPHLNFPQEGAERLKELCTPNSHLEKLRRMIEESQEEPIQLAG